MAMKSSIVPGWLGTPLLLVLSITLQFCSSSKKAASTDRATAAVPAVSYAKDIQPILQEKCTPCHFPETGRKLPLHTYEAVRDNAKDILRRVQLPQDHVSFMPFKNKKAPLTEAEIKLMKDWVAGNMPG
jgi:uncharacterized membrane protein